VTDDGSGSSPPPPADPEPPAEAPTPIELAPAAEPTPRSEPVPPLLPALPPPIPPLDQLARPSLGPPADPAPSTRRLVGASFDLLSMSSEEMRRGSFYIGAIVLGTGGGYALAVWALQVASVHTSVGAAESALSGALGGWLALAGFVGALGLIVAGVESRAMAAAILGGQLAGRPVSVHAALARSRATFWRVIVAAIILAVPVGIVQAILVALLARAFPEATELSTAITVFAAAVVGAPLAYLLTGVVLGDVDPMEATRRSFRVFGARKWAAVLVALFESGAQLLILLGVSAGLDVALRVLGTLGLGVDSGVAGLALTSLAIVVGVFALGTLLFTVTALSIAPQVVMFVGLTHATMGLDHVRPGGDRDPDVAHLGRRRFRRFTRSMLLGFVLSAVALIGALVAIHAFP